MANTLSSEDLNKLDELQKEGEIVDAIDLQVSSVTPFVGEEVCINWFVVDGFNSSLFINGEMIAENLRCNGSQRILITEPEHLEIDLITPDFRKKMIIIPQVLPPRIHFFEVVGVESGLISSDQNTLFHWNLENVAQGNIIIESQTNGETTRKQLAIDLTANSLEVGSLGIGNHNVTLIVFSEHGVRDSKTIAFDVYISPPIIELESSRLDVKLFSEERLGISVKNENQVFIRRSWDPDKLLDVSGEPNVSLVFNHFGKHQIEVVARGDGGETRQVIELRVSAPDVSIEINLDDVTHHYADTLAALVNVQGAKSWVLKSRFGSIEKHEFDSRVKGAKVSLRLLHDEELMVEATGYDSKVSYKSVSFKVKPFEIPTPHEFHVFN